MCCTVSVQLDLCLTHTHMLMAGPLLFLLTPAAPEPEDATASSSSAPDAASGADQGQEQGLPRSASEADLQPPPGVSWKKSKSKRKTVKTKDLDYYALMGLKHERWTATEAQLKHGGCLQRLTPISCTCSCVSPDA
jgi:hypothetical protein